LTNLVVNHENLPPINVNILSCVRGSIVYCHLKNNSVGLVFPDLSVGKASSSDFSEKNDDLIDLIYCA
jgi:hypothetical protein